MDVGRARDQRPETDLHGDFPDLDHLRLGSARHVAQANAFGAQLENRNQRQLEWTFDGKRASDAFRDERFDAGLVPAEIAKRDVEHDRKQYSTYDAEEDTEETLARHANCPPP